MLTGELYCPSDTVTLLGLLVLILEMAVEDDRGSVGVIVALLLPYKVTG